MKGFMGLMVAMIAILAVIAGCETAEAAAVSPAKINPARNTVVYFGSNTFLTGKSCDTLVWSSDRNFNDTLYTCAVFLTNGTTAGPLKATILNDSSVIVTSATAGDSVKYYFYQVLLKKK